MKTAIYKHLETGTKIYFTGTHQHPADYGTIVADLPARGALPAGYRIEMESGVVFARINHQSFQAMDGDVAGVFQIADERAAKISWLPTDRLGVKLDARVFEDCFYVRLNRN